MSVFVSVCMPTLPLIRPVNDENKEKANKKKRKNSPVSTCKLSSRCYLCQKADQLLINRSHIETDFTKFFTIRDQMKRSLTRKLWPQCNKRMIKLILHNLKNRFINLPLREFGQHPKLKVFDSDFPPLIFHVHLIVTPAAIFKKRLLFVCMRWHFLSADCSFNKYQFVCGKAGVHIVYTFCPWSETETILHLIFGKLFSNELIYSCVWNACLCIQFQLKDRTKHYAPVTREIIKFVSTPGFDNCGQWDWVNIDVQSWI